MGFLLTSFITCILTGRNDTFCVPKQQIQGKSISDRVSPSRVRVCNLFRYIRTVYAAYMKWLLPSASSPVAVRGNAGSSTVVTNKMADNLEKDEVARVRKPSSSLVTDVLLKSGRLEKEDINSCVKKTLQKAEEVKASIFCFIASNLLPRILVLILTESN